MHSSSAETRTGPDSLTTSDGVMSAKVLVGATLRATSRAVTALLEGDPSPIVAASALEGAALDGWLRSLPPAALPDEGAVILQTSGSTAGQGKRVHIPNRALLASARATHERLGGPGRWACCLPTHHIAGFQTVFRSLLAGSAPIDAGRGTPAQIAAAARAAERVYISLVPTQLFRLLDSPEAPAARDFAAILLGGAAASPSLLSRARDNGLNVITTYGMTETCGGCVYDGQPIGDTAISLGKAGRITITGSVVASGYLESTPFHGRCVTQDAGRWKDGRLEILGRLDAAITTGGLTVLPGIVEGELEKLGSGECAVVGIPDDQWGEIAVAVTSAPVPNAREQLGRELEPGFVPRQFVTPAALGLDALPHLPSGKVDRQLLQRLLRERL